MINKRSKWFVTTVLVIVIGGLMSAVAPLATRAADTKRVVPVTNVVQKGAQPINGSVVKVEVIDAVDIMGANNWRLKVAVRIRNGRGDRVQCSLAMMFDGKPMGQPYSVDVPFGQSDLAMFDIYGGEGKGADQLSKLTAEARNIRIGE